ncbi:acyl-CoA dehydrogenase family protein [Cupriavidus basilensis]
MGGADLPVVAMVGVNEELGKTITPHDLPPDSPNLRMLLKTADAAQRARYLEPYARGETVSAIAISEPGAGGDPAKATTSAPNATATTGCSNGRKIWISRAARADWTIVMAVTDKQARRARGHLRVPGRPRHARFQGGTAHPHDRRRLHLRGGARGLPRCAHAASRCRRTGLCADAVRGRPAGACRWRPGASAAPSVRSTCCASNAPQRRTFGAALAGTGQAIQWWVADAATRIHACRLMTYEAAARIDAGEEARTQVSMIKVFATEMAWDVIDHAMQAFGAMGMTKEMPLQQMANETRLMRIYEAAVRSTPMGHRARSARLASSGSPSQRPLTASPNH